MISHYQMVSDTADEFVYINSPYIVRVRYIVKVQKQVQKQTSKNILSSTKFPEFSFSYTLMFDNDTFASFTIQIRETNFKADKMAVADLFSLRYFNSIFQDKIPGKRME